MSSEVEKTSNGMTRRAFLVAAPVATVVAVIAATRPKESTTSEPSIASMRHLTVTNEAAVLRAGTVRFLVSGNKIGHGSVIQNRNSNSMFIYTAEHVVDAIKRYQNPQVKIPGVGVYTIDPRRFSNPWKDAQLTESEPSAVYPIDGDMEKQVRFAADERVIQPLLLSQRKPNPGEIIAIPREELAVYTLYKYERYITEQNRYFVRSVNPEATQLCRGDSGSPALMLPINGDTFGVLTSASGLAPENPLSEKICSDNFYIRPNG